jgi:single-stranded-DNA-specific exonuclease
MNAPLRKALRPSFRNRAWKAPEFTEADVDALIGGGANALTAPILAARGMAEKEVAKFLKPKIRDLLPDPSIFKDMDAAADRVVEAINKDQKIAIWSDYDVDGATSAATLGRFLRDCGHRNYEIYIPDRITEGYGPNAEGLLALQKAGADLVVILDAGTVAFEPLEAAHEAGLDVVVIDHHAAEPDLPPAVAIVNPNRLDQEPGYNHVCAAGMTFIFAVAASLRLRKQFFFDGQEGRPESPPELMTYLDLVALGTICDVVPLTTINRAFVTSGLPYLSQRNLPGIKALAAVAACNDEIDPRACGFALGPRINAGGRIGDSGLGAALLLCEDDELAQDMAQTLDDLNRERQDMEKACTAAALEQVLPSEEVDEAGAEGNKTVETEGEDSLVDKVMDVIADLLPSDEDKEEDADPEEVVETEEMKELAKKAATMRPLEQQAFIPGETRALAVAIVDAHEGIVGISAARVKEALDCPAFVLAPTPEGWLKGSGRSVPGFDLGAAIIAARKAGLLVKGGGHAMAGGITIERDKLEAFVDFVNGEVAKSEYADIGVLSKVDAVVSLDRATTGLVDATQSLAPFGMGNPTPRFVLEGVLLADVRVLKDKHVKCIFHDPEMGPAGKIVEGLIWNAVGTPFGEALREAKGQIVDALGALEVNEWNGRRRVQMKIEDARLG